MSQKGLACFPVHDLNELLKLSPFPTPPMKRTDTTKLLWDNRGQRPRPAPARSKWGQVGLCHQSPDNFSYLVAPPPHCADNSSICLTQKAGSVWSTGGVSSLSPRSPHHGPRLFPTKNWHVMGTCWLKNTWWLKSIRTWWALAETKVESIWSKSKWFFFPFDVSQKGGNLTRL